MTFSLRSLRRSAAAIVAVSLAAIVVASCRGDGATAPATPVALAPAAAPQQQLLGLPLGGLLGGLTKGLLACNVRQASSASQTIGSAGGILRVGSHSLIVPPGALASNTLISASAPAGSRVQVHFEPSGLKFAHPTVLTMSYQDCGLVQGLLVRIVYVDQRQNILEVLTSLPNLLTRTVSAPVNHFSNYALAE